MRDLLNEMGHLASIVIVEGPRDVEALRRIGYRGRIEVSSKYSVSDSDFVESLARSVTSVIVLTDFDEEGRRINRDLTRLLERRGVRVEGGLRRRLGRLMAALSIYTVETLDESVTRLKEA
ncbi:MAG: toprim domain-containing protein [Candidatus Bathyarchaeota archaeon]|nr:toprim domain-containing protein [Candidatus Bathyarchaeota archaeon]